MVWMQKLFLWQKQHGLNKKRGIYLMISRLAEWYNLWDPLHYFLDPSMNLMKSWKKTLQKEFNSLSAKFNNVQILKKFLRSLLLWKLK